MHGVDWEGEKVAGLVASEKLDGCRGFWDGEKLWTRQWNEIRLPRITSALPSGVALDGEIFAGRGNFEVAKVATQFGKDSAAVRFVAFDAPALQGGWLDRIAYARSVWSDCVEGWTVQSFDSLVAKLREIHAMRGEGIMLRFPRARYEAGRIVHMLKFKKWVAPWE